jgi:NAD(P)-dependent dehydrogenase (short-subunit alcohol dehydrogenase family)
MAKPTPKRDHVAIVTGAGSGIGRAAAAMLADNGCSVSVWDYDEASAAQTAAEIAATGGNAIGIRVDVREDDAVAAAVAETVDRLGSLTVAFNNAGIGLPVAPLTDIALDDFDNVVATNLRGIFSCMRHQIPRLVENGGGAILNAASVAGQVALAGESAYTATKHGVIGLSKAAAVEYGPAGVRVNAICPGAIRTPMLDILAAGGVSEEALLAMHPIGRLGEPTDVAETATWLLLNAPTFITGAAIGVDGGWTAQ